MSKFKVGDKVKIKVSLRFLDKKYSLDHFTVTTVDGKLCFLNNGYIYTHRDLVLYIHDNAMNRALYPELKPEEGILVWESLKLGNILE